LADTAAVTVGGGTLTLGGNDDVGSLVLTSGTIGGSATLTAATYGLESGTVTGNLGAGTLTKSTAGTVALNGTAGATTVNISAGTLTLGNANRLANTAAVTLTGGGTLDIGGFSDTVGAVTLTSGSITGSGGVLTGSSYAVADGSISAILGGTGIALTKTTGGTVTLSGANTYSGTTTVSAGTLSITGSINSSATIAVNGGLLSTSGVDKLADAAAVTVGGGTLTLGGDDTVTSLTLTSGTIGGSATLTANTYGLQGGFVNGNLGAGVLTKSTGGSVTLNGTAAAATVNITGGTLTLGSAERLADTAAVTVNGGALAIGAFNEAVGSVQLTTGSITGTTGVLTSGATYDMRSGSVSAILGGSVGLTKTTVGTVTLTNANTYTGTTTVSGGTLGLSGAGRLSDSSSLVVNGGTFDIGSVSDTVAGVQLTSGSITGSGGTLTSTSTFDVQGGSVSAILGGSVGLTKTTAGTVTLSGINTYTGATLLSNGDLVVDGSIGSSSLTTIDGGTLRGTGTVGAIQLNSGGAINPAGISTAGTLNTGNIAIVDGQLRFNLGGTGVGQYDQLNTTGTINLAAGGAGAKLVLDAIGTLATTLINDAASGYTTTNALNNAFTLVSNDLTEAIGGAFAKGTFGSTNTKVVTISGLDFVEGLLGSGYYGRINYAAGSDSNDIVLKIVTPEITVTEGATTLSDNGGYNFGDVDKVIPAIPLTKTFTITNDGEVDLMNIAITALTGVHAADYSINTTGTATNLIPGAFTTFTVTFNPSRIGTRTAQFTITSNDLNETTFEIPLTGVGSVGRDLLADGPLATDSWAVAYSGVDAPATPRNGVANAVVVQHSTTADEAVAVFATGHTTNAAGNKDIYVMKYDPNSGAEMWPAPVIVDGGVGRDDEGLAIAVDGSGNVVVAGYQTMSLSNTDVYVAKFNGANGSLIWSKTYSGAGGGLDAAVSLALDPSGNVAVAGYGRNGAGNQDVFMARYLADGTEVFAYLVDGGASRTDGAHTVATDAAGSVYAAGYRNVAAGNKDCYIIKLDSTGDFLWERTIAGTSVTTGSDDEVYSMALDATGNPVLGGTLYNSTGYDLFAAKLNAADGSTLWQRSENPYSFNDSFRNVLVDRNGDIVMAGVSHTTATTTVRYVSKYTTDGVLVWNARLNTANSTIGNLWTGGIALDGEENVVVTGFSVNGGGTRDVYTAKLKHRDGSLLWERIYDGGVAGGANDEGRAVASSLDGYVYVAGYAGVNGGTTAFLLKHYKPLTAPVQTPQTITFPALAEQGVGGQVSLVATATSGLRVRFNVISGPATLSGPNNDLLNITGLGTVVVRASQSGNFTYAPAANVEQSLVITKQAQTITFTLPASTYFGNVVALGATASSGLTVTYSEVSDPSNVATIAGTNLSFTGPGFVTVRASQAGNGSFVAAPDVDVVIQATNTAPVIIPTDIAQRWLGSFAGTGAGAGRAVALKPATGTATSVVMTGYTTTAGGGRDIYTAQYSAASGMGGMGVLEWQATYTGAGVLADEGVAVVVDAAGNVYVAGHTTVSGAGTDVILIMYNSSGVQQWVRTFVGSTASGADAATSLALVGNDVVVAGYLTNATRDFFAARITSANAVTWQGSYDAGTIEGSAAKADTANKVAVHSDGDIALVGNTAGVNNIDDIWTMKLNGTTGERQWHKRYNGTLNREDSGNGLGFDNVGNVLIAGWTNGQASASTYDIYTAKYAGADGALVWQTTYNHPDNLNDSSRDMKVDSQGNVIVTGVSNNLLGNQDMWTGKFNGQTGALAWFNRFNHVRIDQGFSVSLDPNGNVIATGSSGDLDGTTDIYTVKYNTTTGAAIWTQRYEGLNSRSDAPAMVAADGAGSVYVTGHLTNSSSVTEALLLRYAPGGVLPLPPPPAPPPLGFGEVLAAAAPPPPAPEMLQLAMNVEHGDMAHFAAEFMDADGNDTVEFTTTIDGAPGGGLTIDTESGQFSWDHDTSTIAPGAHEIIITVTDEAGASSSVSLAMTVESNHPDRTWRWENFGSTVASGNAENDADPDGDGLSNLAEFAFDLNPNRSGSDVGTRAEADAGQQGGGMRAVFRRRKDHVSAGLAYQVEFSSNLGDWTPASEIPVVVADEGTLEQVSLAFPILPNGSQSRFFRVQVLQQDPTPAE
jgi:fibronectin-binding autotransporter adhesin